MRNDRFDNFNSERDIPVLIALGIGLSLGMMSRLRE
jgi:hypothetical protein